MFDPDVAIGGNQPRGFDQLTAMYQNFTVIASKMEVFCNSVETTAAAVGTINGIALTSDLDALTIENAIEHPYSMYQMTLRGANHEPTKLVQQFSPKYLGYSNPVGETDLRGTAANDPDVQAYFCCYSIALDPGEVASTYWFGHVEYVAIFNNHNLPPAS